MAIDPQVSTDLPGWLKWLMFAQTVIMGFGAWMGWGIWKSYQGGRWIQKKEDALENLIGKVERLEIVSTTTSQRVEENATALRAEFNRRFDVAGQEMSDLGDRLTTLPELMRGIFLPREVYDTATKVRDEERRDLRRQIEQLWERIRGNHRSNEGQD